MATDAKPKRAVLGTPLGRLSYPFLDKRDEGRQYSDNKFKTDLLIPKDVWKKEGKALTEAVLAVAKEHYGKAMKLKDFKHPFKDMDLDPDCSENEKGHIMIRAKAINAPIVVGPDKKPLSPERVQALKGGDYAKLAVVPFPYSQQGGGVSLGLNAVQFAREGEAFGQGRTASIEVFEEMEVTTDDLVEETSESDDLEFT